MKILAITNLFPNALQPERGVFNRQQFNALAKRSDLRVVAPVPWAPPVLRRLNRRWQLASRVPRLGVVDGIPTSYPRYLVTPKIGRSLSSVWLFASLWRVARQIRQRFAFEVIFATWAFPDVVASSWMAQRLHIPLVSKVHGSDIALAARHPIRRRMIVTALRRSVLVIAVSEALKRQLVADGIEADKVVVIPNGVDLSVFKPIDRRSARQALSLPLERRRVVFVGNLVAVKGLPILIEAMQRLPEDVCLSVVGDGIQRRALEGLVHTRRLAGRVEFVGQQPHPDIALWMNAADCCCLPSLSEGCPNVVVEALACGIPVVATRVGGVPELLRNPACGIVVPPRDPQALAEGLQRSLETQWDLDRIRSEVSLWGWEDNGARVAALLNAACNGREASS